MPTFGKPGLVMARRPVELHPWELRVLAERAAVVTTSACSYCDWSQTGPVAETSAAYRQHREDQHPEIQPVSRRKRVRPYGQLAINRNLDDNITHARTQGAATWAGRT
jgi:hypothetical protein